MFAVLAVQISLESLCDFRYLKRDQSSVRNGVSGKPSLLNTLQIGLSAQAYRTATGCFTSATRYLNGSFIDNGGSPPNPVFVLSSNCESMNLIIVNRSQAAPHIIKANRGFAVVKSCMFELRATKGDRPTVLVSQRTND